jgi:hypothetical protein
MEVGDPFAIARQITADQTQPAGAAVFVRKDPTDPKDFVDNPVAVVAPKLLIR